METQSSLIMFGILAVLIIPFIIVGLKKKKRKNQFIAYLFAKAKENNLEIAEHELLNNKLIALDKNNRTIIFLRRDEKDYFLKIIDLKSIKKCTLLSESKSIKAAESSTNVFDKVAISFSTSQNVPPESIEFYNNKYDGLQLSGELQIAEKWVKKINSICK